MKDAKKMLEDFLAEERKVEVKTIESMLKKVEEEEKNKSLRIEMSYSKPVLNFFNIQCIVALIASDYLDKDGKPNPYFREKSFASVSKRVVDIDIDTFLGLAEPLKEDDEKRHDFDIKSFLIDVAAGRKFDWNVPALTIKRTEDDIWKVIGHDGRHRAMLLKKLGYKEMPVCIYFKNMKGEDGKWYIPSEDDDRWADVVYCQNDTFADRPQKKFPFPITKENCYSYYSRVHQAHKEMCCGQTESWNCGAEDSAILMKVAEIETEALKGVPKECKEAKEAFEKDKKHLLEVPVPPIKMKHSNLGELLADREKKGKSEK